MNSQTLILDLITDAVAAHGDVILITDKQYSNVGTLRTLDKGTLQQVAEVSFDFQSGYCHFGPMSDRVAAYWYGESAEGKASWVKGSIPDLVTAVAASLTVPRCAT